MQFVNDDMDELFRRAAENYPLKEEGADWSKVQQQLQIDRIDNDHSKDNKKRYLWLLLLLPLLTFICNKYMGSDILHRQAAIIEEPKVEQGTTLQEGEASHFNKTADNKQEFLPLKNDIIKQKAKGNGVENKKQFVHSSATIKMEENPNEVVAYKVNNAVKKEVKNQHANKKEVKKENKKVAPIPFSTERIQQAVAEQQSNIQKQDKQNKNNNVVSKDKNQNSNPSAEPSIKENKVADVTNAVIDSAEKVSPSPAKKIKQKRWYAGVIAGPDVSKIKSSKVQGTGYSAGIIAGYTINRKWSVEAGLLWDSKKYYAEGRYFDTSKMLLPMHSKIINGDGNCRMIEIPLNVRYNFAEARGHNLFASAGVTSYLMVNEEYTYLYNLYGSSYYAYKEYNNASRDWLSVLTVSMGYQKKLGNIGNVRIEPYLKLPLRGVGIGKLPMSSGGVYIGITRPVR